MLWYNIGALNVIYHARKKYFKEKEDCSIAFWCHRYQCLSAREDLTLRWSTFPFFFFPFLTFPFLHTWKGLYNALWFTIGGFTFSYIFPFMWSVMQSILAKQPDTFISVFLITGRLENIPSRPIRTQLRPLKESQFRVFRKCRGKFDCLAYEMLFINECDPSLNAQIDSICAKLFARRNTPTLRFHIRLPYRFHLAFVHFSITMTSTW